MSFNLFGADGKTYSKFSANLKQETYNPLIIAFNSKQVKGSQGAKPSTQISQGATSTQINQGSQGAKPSPDNQTRILTQSMIVANPSVDLDAEQRKIQRAVCDYVLHVPTSFDVTKETVEAFYESIEKIKKMSGKMNMNHAAASIFLNRGMFEKYVKFVKKDAHMRELARIEQSYKSALTEYDIIGNGMKDAWDLTDLTVAQIPSQPMDVQRRFAVIYTTPTNPPLGFLPFANEFLTSLNFISEKVLTYFCTYRQALYMHNANTMGRIQSYVPALNSMMSNTQTAEPIHYVDNATVNPVYYARQS